jgi:uncharacterized protein (TIGR02246 family)
MALAILDDLNRGFSQHDVEQLLAIFAADPDTVFIGSEAAEVATGAIQLRALLEGLLARPETYQWRWREVLVKVTGPVAWLTTQAILQVEGAERLAVGYRLTLVLECRDGAWRITHYHGSEPAET